MKPLNVVLIGAGNVAFHIGKALHQKGHSITQVYSKTKANADSLAKMLGADAIDSLEEISKDQDFYLIAIKDDYIHEVGDAVQLHDKMVAHTSGSIPLDALSKISENTGVFYPLQTFSKSKELEMKKVPFCIEGKNESSTVFFMELAKNLSDSVQAVDSATRKKIHLAAVFACNFSNHLYAIAEELLEKDGLSLDLLRPLMEETTKKALNNSPAVVQTGPAKRKDEEVMKSHEVLLSDREDLRELYSLLSESILKKQN